MAIELVRVIHSQVLTPGISRDGSILLDKIDKSQGNSDSPPYAQNPKQQVYVPYADPTTPSFAGYVDLIQTDEVKLQAEQPGGVITKLESAGHISTVVFQSNLIATPVITAAVAAGGDVTLTGTTFLSVTPTTTTVRIGPTVNALQTILSADFDTFTTTSIVILDGDITGTAVAGWVVQVFANNKLSNTFTVTA